MKSRIQFPQGSVDQFGAVNCGIVIFIELPVKGAAEKRHGCLGKPVGVTRAKAACPDPIRFPYEMFQRIFEYKSTACRIVSLGVNDPVTSVGRDPYDPDMGKPLVNGIAGPEKI